MKTECPYKDMFSGAYYDCGDCPNYGSSDCAITMNDSSVCIYNGEYKEYLKKITSYKYKSISPCK